MKALRFWMASMMLGMALRGLASAAHAKTDDQAAIKKLENDLAAAIEAAEHLYAGQNVEEICRSHAGAARTAG